MIKRIWVVQAAPGHGKSVRVGPWDVKALYTADAAEFMLRRKAVERVICEAVITPEQTKPAGRYNDVGVLAHKTDGAIAILHLNAGRQQDIKADSAAMTATRMLGHVVRQWLVPILVFSPSAQWVARVLPFDRPGP